MEAFWDKLKNNYADTIISGSIRLVLAIIVLLVGFYLTRKLVNALRSGRIAQKVSVEARSFLSSFIGIGLKSLLIVSACAIMGVPMASIVALIGTVGVAIGLALQGSLSNLAGGIVIMVFRPFRIDDCVTIDTYSGTVKDISIFFTTLRTADNRSVVIPNGQISNKLILNATTEPQRRIDLTFSASYSADVDFVMQTLEEVGRATPGVLPDPAPLASVAAHNTSSIDYNLFCWCDTKAYLQTSFDLKAAVKRAFDAKGIEIPYPQLDVHLNSER